jgi:hypothetical protein
VKSNAIAVSPLEGLLQPARVRDVSCDALTRPMGRTVSEDRMPKKIAVWNSAVPATVRIWT